MFKGGGVRGIWVMTSRSWRSAGRSGLGEGGVGGIGA